MGYLTDPQTFDHANNQDDDYGFDDSNYQQKRKIRECYYSDVVGEYIVDAITGAKYPWRIGTIDEKRFFKVTDTVINGNYDSYNGRSSRKAYYENPHTYMNHKRIDLDEELIQQWYKNVNTLFPKD